MSSSPEQNRRQLASQVAHWRVAASGLGNLDDLASASAWSGLEQYLGLTIRRHLDEVVHRLNRQGIVVQAALDAATTASQLETVRRQLLAFRAQYLRAET